MNIIDTSIPDIKIIEPKVFEDERGFFFESFNQQSFNRAIGKDVVFVQDNHSRSTIGVLRGMHYQLPPHAQGKLVRCIKGEVFDVVVDIRQSSATFGKWVGVNLSDENKHQLWIPAGFAHGFVTLTDIVEFGYKTTDYYTPQAERCIAWNDRTLAIDWPILFDPIISQKDQQGVSWEDAEKFLKL
jgi:dTDP-4-dehydrorhamnose 3,5-epimerase